MSKLAIFGGAKVRRTLFPSNTVIGPEEVAAAERVIRSGVLSKYLGCWHADFYGGPEVSALEKEWSDFYHVKHAVSVNSATSALFCAVGAAGVGPGDEVIVTPYSMTASATMPLAYNAIPVFADIEDEYFCLSPASVESRITEKTKAIIVVDLFGQTYDADKINRIAQKHHLPVIEDCAQGPGSVYHGKFGGTLGTMGVFSLNYHKHIHTGEGGIIVTDDDVLAEKLRLIRNHAEAVVEAKGCESLINMLGFNLRMTELEAALAREQLKKLPALLRKRRENVQYLEEKLHKIPCLEMPAVRENTLHSYYLHAIKFKSSAADGVSRNQFVRAVQAELMPFLSREREGIKVNEGYVKPLYLQPIFQRKILYGGCPWDCPKYHGTVSYQKGICPVCEQMHYDILLTHEFVHPFLSKEDLDDFCSALVKVWENRKNLLTGGRDKHEE